MRFLFAFLPILVVQEAAVWMSIHEVFYGV